MLAHLRVTAASGARLSHTRRSGTAPLETTAAALAGCDLPGVDARFGGVGRKGQDVRVERGRTRSRRRRGRGADGKRAASTRHPWWGRRQAVRTRLTRAVRPPAAASTVASLSLLRRPTSGGIAPADTNSAATPGSATQRTCREAFQQRVTEVQKKITTEKIME